MSTPPLSPPARKASRDLSKSSICSSSTCSPNSREKVLSGLGSMPPLAMIPPAYPPQSTMATLMGRRRREPPVTAAPAPVAAVVVTPVAAAPPAGPVPPKSSRETVPSARFSGATTEASLPSTP